MAESRRRLSRPSRRRRPACTDRRQPFTYYNHELIAIIVIVIVIAITVIIIIVIIIIIIIIIVSAITIVVIVIIIMQDQIHERGNDLGIIFMYHMLARDSF